MSISQVRCVFYKYLLVRACRKAMNGI
uniref:Uncharacterized protein n=1 Tax=Arundo donax TaxID=35708 RepID=A0A0A9C4M8_ARUDO